MSVRVMGYVWDLRLGIEEKLLLLALADHADHNGEHAWPGIGQLAWKTGLTRRGVQRILRRFERARLIEITRPARQHAPNEYRFLFPRGEPGSPLTAVENPVENPVENSGEKFPGATVGPLQGRPLGSPKRPKRPLCSDVLPQDLRAVENPPAAAGRGPRPCPEQLEFFSRLRTIAAGKNLPGPGRLPTPRRAPALAEHTTDQAPSTRKENAK